MNYETKILLFHCLEWLCFWWENQEENANRVDWKDEEWAEEFAGRYWRCEGDSGADAAIDTVPYSAGVFCQEVTDPEIHPRFADRLDEFIAHDIEFFTKISDGYSYEDFMPYWW